VSEPGAPGAPEVSWKAIEENARVYAADGKEVGKVSRVVGDSDADVFTGLAISINLLGDDRFVASEQVSAIWPERVELRMSAAEIERLPEHEETPTVEWRPGRGGLRSALRRFLGR
jgi:sporulation protein YlmC with PRC-barrel domain